MSSKDRTKVSHAKFSVLETFPHKFFRVSFNCTSSKQLSMLWQQCHVRKVQIGSMAVRSHEESCPPPKIRWLCAESNEVARRDVDV